jgi:hypothetical protein
LVHQVIDQVGRMALIHEVVQAGRQQEGLALIVGAVHADLRPLVCHQDTLLYITDQRLSRRRNEYQPGLRPEGLIAQAPSSRSRGSSSGFSTTDPCSADEDSSE